MIEDNLNTSEIYGISKEEIITYVTHIRDNNLPTTKTIINLRKLMWEKDYMPTLRIKVEKRDDNKWYISSILKKSDYSNNWNEI